jgi:hypothetical protein
MARGRIPRDVQRCADWLKDYLADGPRLAKDVEKAGARRVLHWRTLNRAKSLLGYKSYRRANQYWWYNPAIPIPEKAQDANIQSLQEVALTLKNVIQDQAENLIIKREEREDSYAVPADVPMSPFEEDLDRRERGLPPINRTPVFLPIDQIQEIGDIRERIQELKDTHADPAEIAAAESRLALLREQHYGKHKPKPPVTPADERF